MTTIKTSTTGTTYTYRKPANKDKAAQRGKVIQQRNTVGEIDMKTETIIAPTSKGHRIFLEGVGVDAGRYNVEYSDARITIQFAPEGKRKVVASKGGVIDLEGKRVSAWKGQADSVEIEYNADCIIIRRQ